MINIKTFLLKFGNEACLKLIQSQLKEKKKVKRLSVIIDWLETAEINENILNMSLQRIKHGSTAMTQKYKSKKKKKVKLSLNRPWGPIGLRDVKDPILPRQSAHRWQWGC
jgi:hypothetical protein